MRPSLERLESRDCPTLVVGGARAADVVQGQWADCAFEATLASAASQGVDLLSRLHHIRPHVWHVDLYAPRTGLPVSVAVYSGAMRGELWPQLYATAHLLIAPWARVRGESLEVTSAILFGRSPGADDSVRDVGLQAIRAALSRGSVVVCCSDYHAYAVLRLTADTAWLYDPWGFVRRMPAGAFLRKPFEVVIVAS